MIRPPHPLFALAFQQGYVVVKMQDPETLNMYISTLEEPIARPVLEDLAVHLLAFDPQKAEIVKWKT